MVELYNNVADPSGVTRGKNPYNAKVVRSFIERGKWYLVDLIRFRPSSFSFSSKLKNFHADTTTSRFYFFNITGLEVDESVLEAELHLYRKRTPLKALHPSILTSPYYLVSVYIYIYIDQFLYSQTILLSNVSFRFLDKGVSSFG